MRALPAAFALALALTCAPPAAAQSIQPAPLRIMPVGDSITEGGDGTGGFRRPLFDMISAAYGMPNLVGARNMRQSDPADFVDHDEDGYSAYRIDQIATGEGFWNAQPIETRLAAWDPAIVTIHAGTNDAQQDYFFWGSERKQLPPVIDRLDDLVSRVVAYNPAIYVIVAQIIPANAPASRRTQDYIVRLDAEVPAMVAKHQARGERVSMVDMYTPMLAHPNPDGIHPDAAGYAVMAQVWFQGMQAAGALPGANPDPGRAWGLHQVDRFSTESSTPWTLSPNLIRSDSPTLAGAETTGYFGKHPPSLLNDGSLHSFTDDHDYASVTTYTLATTGQAAKGYDLREIRSDAGEITAADGDERSHQSYEVWWAGVDAPDAFVQLGAFHHIMVNTAERASQVVIARADGTPLATGVAKIQFRFTQPPLRQYGFFGIDTPTPYREIEVLGEPTR
jgi:lysophospholipase L1-like esterase